MLLELDRQYLRHFVFARLRDRCRQILASVRRPKRDGREFGIRGRGSGAARRRRRQRPEERRRVNFARLRCADGHFQRAAAADIKARYVDRADAGTGEHDNYHPRKRNNRAARETCVERRLENAKYIIGVSVLFFVFLYEDDLTRNATISHQRTVVAGAVYSAHGSYRELCGPRKKKEKKFNVTKGFE